MGNKKKKSRAGTTEERSKTVTMTPEHKTENKPNKSGSLKIFILIGIGVIIPIVAVIYSNESYQTYIYDILKNGVIWKSESKLDVENREIFSKDLENNEEKLAVSSQNQHFDDSIPNGGNRNPPSSHSETLDNKDLKKNIQTEPPSQNVKTLQDQNQYQNSKILENKSKLGRDPKLECETKHSLESGSCSKPQTTSSEKETQLKKKQEIDPKTVKQDIGSKSETDVKVQSDSKPKTPVVQQEGESESETPSVKKESDSKSETPSVKKESDSKSETPNLKQESDSKSKTPSVKKESDSKLETPSVKKESNSKSETTSVKKESDSKLETPSVKKESDSKSETPDVKKESTGSSKSETQSIKQESESKVETQSIKQESDSKLETSKDQKKIDSKLQSNSKQVPYQKSAITNEKDFEFQENLDEADSLLEKGNIEEALRGYDKVLMKYPSSPRAFYGKAETLDKMAERQRSNSLLEEAIASFQKVLDVDDVPEELVIKAGTRLAERQQFRGWGGKAVKTLKSLCTRFPENLDLKKKLGVGYLIIGQIEKSKQVFREILKLNPNNGFAKVHLGFIIKTSDNDPKTAIPFLKEGINSNEEGTQDGRFYFHLGDAYQRLQQSDKAYKLYEEGAEKGLFRSAYQRSLYNVDHLTGRPWWKPDQTGYQSHLKMLEENWRVIKEEGVSQLDMKTGSFVPEEENLREKGDWKQFTLYQQGMKIKENCAKVPKTCELIDKIPDAKGCKRGQVKFSVMQPGVHVWPHCGPTNCRIRAHLGLVVPKGPRIRVGNDTRQWSVGKFIIFDDSFEHEVWHNGTELRLVLIVDFWHPELSAAEKRNLTPI